MSVASASTAVKFHDFPSGAVCHNYQPGSQVDGPIRSLSWSKDGNWLALVPHSGQVEIVSIKDQLKLIHTIQGIEEPSCAVFQNTTKKNIAVGTKSGQVLIYDIKARNIKKRYPRTTCAVTHVAFTTKDNHVVAACSNGEALIYSNTTNNLSGTFKIPKSQSINALHTNPIKRNYVVAGSNEGVVAVWDINVNKIKFSIDYHKAPVTSVMFSPINSDLVVSTGLDRQFCFYDIGGNRCVSNILVENSMTSVDFTPDGKFVVVGSQKGIVYVYDMKNLHEPMHSFPAHNSSIKHLLFRKAEDVDSSICSGIFESVKQRTLDLAPKENSGSFRLGLSTNSDYLSPVVNNKDCDSFMMEIGLDGNHTAESQRFENSVKFSESVKFSNSIKATPNTVQDKVNFGKKTPHLSSTPKYLIPDLVEPVSPIISQSVCTEKKSDDGNLENFIRNTVKEELKGVIEEMKKELKYHSTHIIAETQQMILGQVMTMVKESIKVENSFTNLNQNLETLYEENLLLKQKFAAVENELAALKNNMFNKNFL